MTLEKRIASSEKLAKRIAASESLLLWLDTRIDDTRMPLNLRFRLAGGCLDVAMEHHHAIVLLTANARYGSAAALARLLLEAYVRGVWLHQCANEEEVKSFESDTLDRSFASFLKDVEKLEPFKERVLSAVKASSWDVLCSYTHTGFHQVVRRNREDTIEPNYDEGALIEVLDFADGFGIMAAVEIAHLASDDYLAVALLEQAKALADARDGTASKH